MTTLQTVKAKMTKLCYKSNNNHQNAIDLALLDIADCTYHYNEYCDGLVSDDFENNYVHL